ncbi:AI-2E family transporter [Mycolicibacterium vinylchloridicum]|uniref:AI-2E family transporter n=1 Tax=Mycolicibacterium vinylchloridicum TaxID=2736928 RepID=UPI0015CA6220|nr:AI-2E family transporter [Mycolicibacterium vinylchloridicum]
MNTEFTLTQKRALAIITLLALVLGAYFLRHYFILVVIAAIVAYLFTPLYNRCRSRFGSGLSATLTVLAALATVIIPVGALLTLAVLQISHMVVHVAEWVETADMSTVGNQALEYVNQALGRLPFGHFSVSTDSLRDTMISVSQNLGRWALHALQGAAGGVIGVVTSAIIFLYVLVSLLTNSEQLLLLIRRLNPLGEEVTDLYLAKMGAMVKGTVKGQFIIALVQGVLGAASIYIGGFHDGFFIFAIFLTALSVIPLGSGIVTIPFGIGMMLFGNIGGGLFVVLFHIIGVTNVDNFLRPILVPREARLDPALMLLAVFSGIAMFGFWGIVLGPVLMIIIVTTISVYLAVYKGVEMTSHEPPEKRRRMFRRRLRAEAETTAAAADGEPAQD